ncbi:hypothetical protein CDAR_601361 [Caerostris darwini]|uniref:BHLH domain-containing protein n=1 Tax=Caerostris darwini TaxID=1538125 RepID=A0AAV4WW77_9ARAC|nr:hypothetical protein CDAR_601361 [Caerostris darwini]
MDLESSFDRETFKFEYDSMFDELLIVDLEADFSFQVDPHAWCVDPSAWRMDPAFAIESETETESSEEKMFLPTKEDTDSSSKNEPSSERDSTSEAEMVPKKKKRAKRAAKKKKKIAKEVLFEKPEPEISMSIQWLEPNRIFKFYRSAQRQLRLTKKPRRANKQLRRLASNERERERNQTMIHAFHSLQDVLPENMGSRERSKLETLIMAKNYIMSLTNVICIIKHIPFRYDLFNEDPLAGDSTTDGSQMMDN